MTEPLSTVILISGRGSNLRAILEAVGQGLPAEIRGVISNRPGAGGLVYAAHAGIPTRVLDHKSFATREAFDSALRQLIEGFHPQLLVLAGFLRVLTPAFVAHFRGRMLNIHPSLLPDYPGLDTHRRVLAAGEKEHGATVHFVTDEVDGGPVVVQARVPVLEGDTPEVLAARVLQEEHRIFPLAIRWFAEGRLRLEGDTAVLDGNPLRRPIVSA